MCDCTVIDDIFGVVCTTNSKSAVHRVRCCTATSVGVDIGYNSLCRWHTVCSCNRTGRIYLNTVGHVHCSGNSCKCRCGGTRSHRSRCSQRTGHCSSLSAAVYKFINSFHSRNSFCRVYPFPLYRRDFQIVGEIYCARSTPENLCIVISDCNAVLIGKCPSCCAVRVC